MNRWHSRLLDHPAEAIPAHATMKFLGDQHNVSERIEHGYDESAEKSEKPRRARTAGLFGRASAGEVLLR